ncbi:antigen peptide transporter 2-like [Oncorhynchus nerka]|uniref:antigen peptide transporter 2-like n=1 Tax=Oncorhynchus nerka TaxID=8023 RepID=UPI001132311C|nr:antigen peptide transporter 2-like [Oncorhynchus nerka]XP_029519316.1 antigen peptide transporter 2-like [Oncorhynchus nerka]
MMLRTCVFAMAVGLCIDITTFCATGFGASISKTGPISLDVFGNLVGLWVVAGIRLVILFGVSLLTLGSIKTVLKRWLAVHCFLAPVYETGQLMLHGSSPESTHGSLGGPSLWLLCTAAAAAAALFWEKTFPDSNEESNGKEKTQKARVLFTRVLYFYRPDTLLLVGAFIFLSLAVLCEMFIPFYTGKVIDILASQYKWNDFLTAIILMGLYSLGSSFSAGCRGGLFMCAINSFTSRMKVELFGALVKQEISFFETIKTGDITSRLSTDTTKMARAVALNVNVLLRTLIKIVGMLSLMMSLSWKLTLLMLMETPVTGLLQGVYDNYYLRLTKEVQDSMARANEAAGETVAGIRTVRSFNTERSEAGHYDHRLMDTHNLKTRRDTVRAVYVLLRRLTALVMQVAMLYYGRLFIQRGQMSTGNLVSFILYQSNLGTNIRTLIYIFGDMLNSVGAAGKVFEYLDREPQVSTKGTLQPETLTGHVHFHNLSFSYPTRQERKVLQGFSLELRPGQLTALVGPSGGGKSTCVSLLERFYQPQQGEILLDGQPLHSYQHHYLHRKVAMVGQEPVLFSGSIKDNIAYGLADCSLERVQEAARRANAHSFISQLEKGYDSDVGERGGQMSGGEKQRIAIARALIREPQVLILDEVTSALDTESEHMVQEALASCPSQTLLVIAHRLKTIERADQIILIDQGTVLEQGTHQELMDRKGGYYKLRERLFTEDDTSH